MPGVGPSSIATGGSSSVPGVGPSSIANGGSSSVPGVGPSSIANGGSSTVPGVGPSSIANGGGSSSIAGAHNVDWDSSLHIVQPEGGEVEQLGTDSRMRARYCQSKW